MARSHKASLTSNPLGNPQSAIQALAVEFQEFLHFPDPAPLYAVMGAMAANMMPGNPVWLMLIGPPSCGKTVLLETLTSIPRVHSVSTIKGEPVLLSAVGKKDRSQAATGGLLRQVGEKGAIIIKDFTSMISMPHETLTQTMAALREIYDGKWDRPVGSDGGHVITWEGKLAMLAACTAAIDRHHSLSNDMGERWIYYRFTETDGYGETNRALSITDPEASKGKVRELVRGFFDAQDLDWSVDVPKRKLTQAERQRIISIASFAARARSAVPRNAYSREVEDTPQREAPVRIATALGQLYLGMEMVGVENSECWRVVGKIALDSMPQTRLRALERIRKMTGDGVESTHEDVRDATKCSMSQVRRVVEDLELHGIVSKNPDKKMWRLSKWAKEELERGWGTDKGKA